MRLTPAGGPIQKEAIVKRMTVLLAVCMMFLVISIQAQAPQGPPKPGPEVKKLDYNIGTWNVEGEAKPFGPMPGGKFTATEKCEWYSGGFFVMCHSEGTVNGDTWNWTAESKMGEAKISVRVTIKQVSKTEYTFKLEMSQNGGE